MIVQTTHPETHLKTWVKRDDGAYWVPDQDRPDGYVFTAEPVDLDTLTPQALDAWKRHQERRYGATAER